MDIPKTSAARPSVVNEIKMRNLCSLMLYLLSCGEMTKLDLLQRSGLSMTTISDLINHLLRLGIVQCKGTQKSTGGRQPSLYHIDRGYGRFIGITMEKDALSIALTDMHAKPLGHTRHMNWADGNLLYALYEAVDAAIRTAGDAPFLAIGLGVPGTLDLQQGVILASPLADWQNVPMKEILERRYALPVFIDHIVNSGTLYQQVFGAARQESHFACHFSRFSDHAALVMDGHLCRGRDNACLRLGSGEPLSRLIAVHAMLALDAVFSDAVLEDAPPCMRPLVLPDAFFETAAALMAEIFWFEQIYTIGAKSPK